MSELTFEELAQQPIDAESESVANHADTLLEGFYDNVSGTEGLSLTHAQRYLNGVLYANDIISHDVAGMEGGWSTIKAGIAKTWKMVKDAIHGLWNWIFGDTPKKLDKEIKETIEINFPKIKALPDYSELNTDRLNAIRSMAKEYKESGNKIAEAFKETRNVFNKLESISSGAADAAFKEAKKEIDFLMKGFDDDSGIQQAVDHASSRSSIESLKAKYEQARKHEETIIQTLRSSKKEGETMVQAIEQALSSNDIPAENQTTVKNILQLAKQYVKLTGQATKAYERRMRTLSKLVHMTSDKLFDVNKD